MTGLNQFKTELKQSADPVKADFLSRFFKTHPGGYGEGDRFLGVSVPVQRRLVRKYEKILSLSDIMSLLHERFHEFRQSALFMLVSRYKNAKDESAQEQIVNLYLQNTAYVNNWDLVDSSADKILGAYFLYKDKELLFMLARSHNLWEQRIAVMATFHFIKNGIYGDTLKLAEILIDHPHDLIHKAVGWMLREVGKRNFEVEYDFLLRYYRKMPRTMLRYAIEKFPEELRQQFLKGTIDEYTNIQNGGD